jgi:hypothetical protein
MKYWVALLLITLFSASASAEVTGATQDFIAKKRYEASQAKKLSQGKIEYLRNNKDKTNIIGTGAHYNLDDLETASGNKPAEKTEEPAKTTTENKELKSKTETPAHDAGSLNSNTKVEFQEAPNGL